MDPEVMGDLFKRHPRPTVTRNPHDIVTELFGKWSWHTDILSAHPLGQAISDVTSTCSRPKI